MLVPTLVACNKDGVPDGYQLIVCEGDKFRLYVPTSWISNTESGITGAYSTVDENASVCVYMLDVSAEIPLADYWSECEANYTDSFEDFTVISKDEKYSLGGSKAICVEFSLTKKITSDDIPENVEKTEKVKYKYLQVISRFDGDTYTLIFGAPEANYDKHIATVKGEDSDGEFAGIIPYFEFTRDPYYTDEEKEFSHKVEAPEGMKLVSTEERPYRFFVPETWQADYRSALSAAYYSEDDKSNVSLQGHMLGVDNMALEDYFAQSEDKCKSLYGDGYTLVSKDDTLLMGDQKSLRYTYTVKSGENEYKIMQSICVKGAMAYVFTYTSTPDKFDSHLEDINKMLDAFLIR